MSEFKSELQSQRNHSHLKHRSVRKTCHSDFPTTFSTLFFPNNVNCEKFLIMYGDITGTNQLTATYFIIYYDTDFLPKFQVQDTNIPNTNNAVKDRIILKYQSFRKRCDACRCVIQWACQRLYVVGVCSTGYVKTKRLNKRSAN